MIDFPVLPMLAVPSQPFDSDDHVFEVKWDGVRALAAVTRERCRVWGRGCVDYTDRYPELQVLQCLPPGTVLDGELVVLRHGVPDLHALLRRHPLVEAQRIRHASKALPVRYLLFDLLALRGRSLVAEPLHQRRAALAELLGGLAEPLLAYSDGVIGAGKEFFERAVSQGHEGVVAKHRASRYTPGKRSPGWRKIKPVEILPCVIVGYLPGAQGVRCLLVAATWDGCLRYAAALTHGVSAWWQAALLPRLARLKRDAPVVDCPQSATWVEPELYRQVRFRRRMPDGRLQDAVFVGLLDEALAA